MTNTDEIMVAKAAPLTPKFKQQVDCNNLPDNPVKRIRTRLGLEQAPFAEMLGCSDKYVSMLENGNRKVSYRLAEKIIKIDPKRIITP